MNFSNTWVIKFCCPKNQQRPGSLEAGRNLFLGPQNDDTFEGSGVLGCLTKKLRNMVWMKSTQLNRMHLPFFLGSTSDRNGGPKIYDQGQSVFQPIGRTYQTKLDHFSKQLQATTWRLCFHWWLNHPFEKYARQNGSFPQIGVKIKTFWSHHLVTCFPQNNWLMANMFSTTFEEKKNQSRNHLPGAPKPPPCWFEIEQINS